MNSMKKWFLASFVCIFPYFLHAQNLKIMTIKNPSNFARPDELIVLQRRDLEMRIGPIAGFIQINMNSRKIAVQHDDLNDDGRWDEAVFLYSFAPKELIHFTIRKSKTNDLTGVVQRAHVRLKKKNGDDSWGPNITREQMPLQNPPTDFSKQPLPPYLTEGPAWENDKVGFRLYFDIRNGKDIWGKRTLRMVLDSVGTKVEPTYHDLHDWGMDVLHVGNSLGAGALALLIPQTSGKDTLMRIGGTSVVKTSYRQIADGPLRAIFQIDYDLKLSGKIISLSEQTSVWGGQYFYESKVFISGAPANTKLVSGIASFYNNVFRTFSMGNCSVLLSHGKQSENKDYMGMAILVPKNQSFFSGSSPNENSDILNTYIAAMNVRKGHACDFRFYVAWERTLAQFDSINFFSDMLRKETEKEDHPIQIIF